MDTYPYSALYWAFCKCSGTDNCNVQANNCGGSPKDGAILQVWQQPVQRVVVGRFDVCVSYSQTCDWQHQLHLIYDRQRRENHHFGVNVTIGGR